MPEQVGRCDDQATSFGVCGFESDKRPDVLCSEADASSVCLSLAFPNFFFIVEDSVVCNVGVFRATVGNEQAVLLTMSGFVDGGVSRFLDDRDELFESIDFLCI